MLVFFVDENAFDANIRISSSPVRDVYRFNLTAVANIQ